MTASADSSQLQRADSSRATPKRQRTQEEQDKLDDQARHEAMHNLVQSWQDRLQLIALITTFFAAAEINFLVMTTGDDTSSAVRQTANACFNGAVVFHAFSATVSFLAAFLLVGYKLKEANKEKKEVETGIESPENEAKAEEGRIQATPVPAQTLSAPTLPPLAPSPPISAGNTPRAPLTLLGRSNSPFHKASNSAGNSSDFLPNISMPFSANPRMVQTYFLGSGQPPVHLLERLHTCCTWSALNGFILAFVGMVCYTWAWHARAVAIFTSACLAACVASVVIFVSTGSYVIQDDD
ncbi:hypothetical protein DACRYDRAFT_113534 [Dacryopinax primogenitus]|uniref:Transmembrane protein n=1 Tax=Dacryopinax primogenitus (strain DJM 731) TaxID=1858805 RepID=M5G571_DACPD|nr:uncharacterized protein DACRYDRAFT_113534 [Dacryopinax primogenitus]EJU05406.1 hypothetical protein DACRYDRAFT_113534 [Dacryopinax primogenitus]